MKMACMLVWLVACGGKAPPPPVQPPVANHGQSASPATPPPAPSAPSKADEWMKALASIDRDDPRSISAAMHAADELGVAKPAGAVDTLADVATKPPDEKLIAVEIAAIRSLGKFSGDATAVRTLIEIVARPVPQAAGTKNLFLATRGAAVNALGELHARDAAKQLVVAMYETPELMMQIRRALVATGPAAQQEVEGVMRGENAAVHAVLSKHPDAPPTNTRDFYAAIVLGDFRDPKDQPVLLAALERMALPAYYDDDGVPAAVTQYNAVFDALRKIGGADSAATVRKRMRDTELKTRILAIDTYPFVTRDGAGYEELGKIAADNNADDELRQAAAAAFARLAHDDKSIKLLLDLAQKYLDASAKKAEAAAKKKPAADAADQAFAQARAGIEQVKQHALDVAHDPNASVAEIKQATDAAKQAESVFKLAKKQHHDQVTAFVQLTSAAKAYHGYARMFQTHVARIEIAIRCKSDLACYAGALKATPDDAAAFVGAYIKDAASWTAEDKRELLAAEVDRAMCELGKRGLAARDYTGALLDAAASDHKLVREAVLLALPKITPVPCAECETKLAAAARGDDRVETEILRNYYHWAGGR